MTYYDANALKFLIVMRAKAVISHYLVTSLTVECMDERISAIEC